MTDSPESDTTRWLTAVRERVVDDSESVALLTLSGIIAVLMVSPLFWLFIRAAEVEPDRAFSLLFRTQTFDIIISSLILLLTVTILSVLIGVPLALLTARTDLPFRRFWTIVASLPLVVPSYIGAFAFVGAFGPSGELGSLFGVSLPAIEGIWWTGVIITLYTYPYVFLTTRAGLLSMDGSLVDAARTLNATRWEAFRRVTFPQIRPAIAAGALLASLYAISDFGTPTFMRVEVFTSAIYLEFFGGSASYAALLALNLIAIVAVILVIEAGIGRDEDASSGAESSQIQLGFWKWPAMGSISFLGIITLVTPIAIFGQWWLSTDETTGFEYEFQWLFAFNSVQYAALAAFVACLLALPVAYTSARSRSVLARVFERATYVGFAVPGIVIALALVFLGSRMFPGLYRQGIVLLIFAYVVRFLPQAVGTVRSSVLQVGDRHIEAARTLNATRFEAFRRITLPLILPGLIAGAVLVFLTTMKELPITLMLAPLDTQTLVTIIWEAHDTLYYSDAAVPAFLLIFISGLTMLVLLRQEDSDIN